MTAVAQRHPQSLSGGEKQRVVIACALAKDPSVLILDEPTSGLDGANMTTIAELLKAEAHKGRAVFLITHDLELLSSCDRALFMRFTQNESCGKCVPCREGTKRMLEILDRIIANEGSLEDLDLLQELSKTISETALCGLGQSACKPVQSTLRHFRQDYLRHVVDHHCPICNGRKRRLVIKPELCKGCGKCKRNCPMEAISGEIRMPHTIDNDKCIHCGACWGACPFGAIDAIEEED